MTWTGPNPAARPVASAAVVTTSSGLKRRRKPMTTMAMPDRISMQPRVQLPTTFAVAAPGASAPTTRMLREQVAHLCFQILDTLEQGKRHRDTLRVKLEIVAQSIGLPGRDDAVCAEREPGRVRV